MDNLNSKVVPESMWQHNNGQIQANHLMAVTSIYHSFPDTTVRGYFSVFSSLVKNNTLWSTARTSLADSYFYDAAIAAVSIGVNFRSSNGILFCRSSPKCLMLFAAKMSRSWFVPQAEQVHSLSNSLRLLLTIPQLHIFDDGSNLPIVKRFFPYHSHL